MKHYHTKYKIEIKKKRISSLETRNMKLQDTMNEKCEKIENLQRQIDKIAYKILKAKEVDTITKEKLKDCKSKYTSIEMKYLAECNKYIELDCSMNVKIEELSKVRNDIIQ